MSEIPELKQYFSNISYSAVICRKDNATLTEAQAEEIIHRCICHEGLVEISKEIASAKCLSGIGYIVSKGIVNRAKTALAAVKE